MLRDELQLRLRRRTISQEPRRSRARGELDHLDWVGFLPASGGERRVMRGDHILTQSDVNAEGRFDDVVAYGGWPFDDLHPPGYATLVPKLRSGALALRYPLPGALPPQHREPSRGRAYQHHARGDEHDASWPPVPRLAQAVGTAAALAVEAGLTPRGVTSASASPVEAERMMPTSPGTPARCPSSPEPPGSTASEGDPEPLRNGLDRPHRRRRQRLTGSLGSWVALDGPREVKECRFST